MNEPGLQERPHVPAGGWRCRSRAAGAIHRMRPGLAAGSALPDGLARHWDFDHGDLLQHHGTSVQKEAQETLGEER